MQRSPLVLGSTKGTEVRVDLQCVAMQKLCGSHVKSHENLAAEILPVEYRQQRKFTLATLKSLAGSFEEKVQEESRYLVETIEEEKDEACALLFYGPAFKNCQSDISKNNLWVQRLTILSLSPLSSISLNFFVVDSVMAFLHAVSNIICSITFGNRFDYHDNRFQELLHSLAETLLLIGSFWGQVRPIGRFSSFSVITSQSHALPVRKGTRSQEEADTGHLTQTSQRDIPYHSLSCPSKGDTGSYFHEENLLCSTLDLFLTGTETTATAIRWALLYMATYPHIQEKVQLEINTVIGQSRQPTMADKENMPYTSAVLSEVLRMSNVVPLGVPRTSTSDTTLAGFHLPKGTTVMTSLTSIMFDKNVWETPDTFNPDHFLDNGQYRRREAFLPFSAGKRACPGEQLARTELFIFFTALLQKFTFQAPEAAMLTFAFTLSLTRCPKPFRICALLRD
ncbi:cytochrome P450 2J2-like [Guaruba guarouba]